MTAHAIDLTDVRFRWRDDKPPVIDIPALTIARGEKVLIRGPSGGGKTTLLNLLGGVAAPERGNIRVLDTDIVPLRTAQRDRFRADNIGFIFQMFNLVPYLSLIENVLLPCRFSVSRRRAAAETASTLEQAAARLLSQMALDVTGLDRRPVTELSTGQQQRVAAARALIGSPPLIIADEPTSALDADTRHAFIDLLFREVEQAGATLLFVSHDADLAQHFERSIALADINRGTPT
ncbi:MAG: ATP-binding cassette domain-containing protein [Alphaproteobacteria bacterium]|nr:ATP-binding cassette domain-containing protein [Alphaproteobacteria bacterium]